jgi:hypothetical protein
VKHKYLHFTIFLLQFYLGERTFFYKSQILEAEDLAAFILILAVTTGCGGTPRWL